MATRARSRNGRFVKRRRSRGVMAQARTVARRYQLKRRGYRRKSMTLPLAVVAGFVPLGVGLWHRRTSATEMGHYLMGSVTGYVPGQGWNIANMKSGGLPILAGFVAHKVASKLGVNRLLAQARVPFFRI